MTTRRSRKGGASPIIAKTFVFGRIVAAHRYLDAGEQFGKIVVPLESDS
ncbi:zinc-binding dehydrogenase [Pseudomonas sp. B21-048]|nr:zinc-binding dehydrogenase [Pseudomonas sp. B21-048]UVK98196.1 zinc-binding dehydrogenase [Pseudomonas sp. B21-048]